MFVGTSPDTIMALAISPDGRWVASGEYRGSVTIWDITRRKIESRLEGKKAPSSTWRLAQRSILAAAQFDKTVTIWDTKSAESAGCFRPNSVDWPLGFLARRNNSRRCVSDCAIALWDTVTWRTA